ncbi:hypothetical protein [Streptomyces spiramenti]|uniref:Lipoprotein n=1 Tax=Streptomyces spiramenti TaxID=2720606 RepID=A0ABX1AKN6_9ACTN|nr:hypothetical protein [Streptomyces spiramenti]NJP65057.1 hypothetical protein [Streptomyces spiramenti]
MKRHLVLPVAAVAAAGLLLTSCSGGDSEPDDDIAGVQSPSPSEEPDGEGPEDDADSDAEEPDDGIDRPEIELPDDMTKEFEDVDTDDPDELAVLADQERFVAALNVSITRGEAIEALNFYATGEGYITALELVADFRDDGYSIGGDFRYLNRSVSLGGDGTATSTYCSDFADSYSLEIESGEEYPEGDEPFFYSFAHEVNDSGVWQVTSWLATSEADECV